MHKDAYRSAMEKISATEEWKQKTLEAMREAQGNVLRETKTVQRKAPRTEQHAKAFGAKRWPLLAAAALVALAIPAVWFGAAHAPSAAVEFSAEAAEPREAAQDIAGAYDADTAVGAEQNTAASGEAEEKSAAEAACPDASLDGAAKETVYTGTIECWAQETLTLLLADKTRVELACAKELGTEYAPGASVEVVCGADGEESKITPRS